MSLLWLLASSKNGDLPEAKGGREEMFSKKIFPFQLTEYSTTDLVVSPIAVKRKSEYRTAQLAEFPPTLFTTKVVSPVARLMARKRNFPFERSHVGIGFLNKPPAPLSISFSSSIQEVLEEWQVSPDSSFVGDHCWISWEFWQGKGWKSNVLQNKMKKKKKKKKWKK